MMDSAPGTEPPNEKPDRADTTTDEPAKPQRRPPLPWSVFVISLCFCLGNSSLYSMISIGSLALRDVLEVDGSLILVPLGVQSLTRTLLSALASQRRGKKNFMMAAVAGILGAVLCLVGLLIGSGSIAFLLFTLGSMLFGCGDTFNFYLRFLAAELVEPGNRPRAISLTVAGGSFAAIMGPGLAQQGAHWFHIKFVGSIMTCAIFYGIYLLLICTIQFPDPPDPSVPASRPTAINVESGIDVPAKKFWQRADFWLPLFAATTSYFSMVSLMAITPIAMRDAGMTLLHSTVTVQVHILGMFMPSFYTGNIIQRLGLLPVIFTGWVLVLSAGLTFGVADDPSFATFLIAHLAIGIGWNFSFVGATAWLTTNFPPSQRSKEHGMFDFANGCGVVTATFLNGPLYANLGFGALGWLNFLLDLVVGCGILATLLCTKPKSNQTVQSNNKM